MRIRLAGVTKSDGGATRLAIHFRRCHGNGRTGGDDHRGS
jgi:hypothetical protein